MNNEIIAGFLILTAGIGYLFWNLRKEPRQNPTISYRVDIVNSWGLTFALILIGLALIFKNT